MLNSLSVHVTMGSNQFTDEEREKNVLIINELPFHENLQIKWLIAKEKVDKLYGESSYY